MKDPIVFKTEDSLWQMMATGQKQWDARRFDVHHDERIYRLCLSDWEGTAEELGRLPFWCPEESEIHFKNVKTGEVLVFSYRGFHFLSWAPGWVFFDLGGIIRRYGAPGA